MKVLIIRFSSSTDVILSTPVIRNLKIQLDAEVHYLTSEPNKKILQENPYLDKVFDNLYDVRKAISILQKEKYDYIIDLQKNRKSILIRIGLGVKSYSIKDLGFKQWLYVNLKINQLPNRHRVDMFMEAVKPLGVKKDLLGVDYFIQDMNMVEQNWLPEDFHEGYTVLAIHASYETRKLPRHKLIELCDKINKPIIIIGYDEDKLIAHEVKSFFTPSESSESIENQLIKLNKKTIVHDVCGRYNIDQMASLIKKADHVFTYDSEFLQIAASFKKDIYSIWGNTVPYFGYYPYKTKFKVFENNRIDCRPCSKNGFSKCPKKHFKCMNDIVFDFYLP